MSIQTEIDRITEKRDDALAAVAEKGVDVPSGAGIDDLPALIRSISTEGDPMLYYGTCSTSAGTQQKVVTIDGITELTEGLSLRIKFASAQTYNGAPTLNLNSLGAKNIRRNGTANAARYEWLAGEVLDLVYDGTAWLIVDGGIATTTYYGQTKLATGATSTSTSLALTPASLNSLAQNMIAGVAVYSASATYAVGDRCRYGYYIYECITAITTAEAWTASHWQALASIQEQIDELQVLIRNISDDMVVGSHNLIINSKPWKDPGSAQDETGWANFRSNSAMQFYSGPNYFSMTNVASIGNDERFQIQKYNYYHGTYIGGFDASEFNDGDPVIISWDVKSDSPFDYHVNFNTVATQGGTTIQVGGAATRKTIDTGGKWKRVYLLGTIPEGYSAALNGTPYTSSVNFVHYFSAASQVVYLRNFMLAKGNVQANWSPNETDIIISARTTTASGGSND